MHKTGSEIHKTTIIYYLFGKNTNFFAKKIFFAFLKDGVSHYLGYKEAIY